MTDKHTTRADLVALVAQDIARSREEQRTATANGDTFTAEAHGQEIDSLLDEREQYDY